MNITNSISELLIASLTPQNLERGVLWFSENLPAIKKARHTNPWWRENTLFLELDLILKPAEFSRKLLDLGYERGQSVYGRGIFSIRGNLVEVWPVNTDKPYLIEFTGNTITLLQEREEGKERIKPRRLALQSIKTLPSGSFVVHEDHGIGIFRGIVTNSNPPSPTSQFFLVEYAPPSTGREPDRLYVPLDQQERLTPYIGFETPRIHRLGGTVWITTKRKAREETEKLAKELLELYAKRQVATREPYRRDSSLEEALSNSFPFEETEDQLRVEGEILRDLEKSDKPMDRVLCGDVGFGKTEVALRAAFRVMTSGRQAALLAPTTILAAQHEKTFRARFHDLPVTIRMLSRLLPAREQKEILQELKQGKIDCLIGTHRILSKDVEFKNLGMIIVDEEQRFGVKQKERFKEMRSEVDILSLSATPIPRTLQLALANLRDISLIKTPPPDRLAIQTFVLPYSTKIVKSAIEAELKRGGQVYFLHNRIETIGRVREKLQAIRCQRPLRIEIMHGRLKEKEILRAMQNFRERKVNLLLATTIIENGLDISSANTLIVDDATRLGLAESHQLRGRIGRGSTQGFAYFLYRPRRMTDKAAERLEALEQYAELGAGYEIALRDLEIRGAGNILGAEQSGAMNRVGLNLYCQMLAEAVDERRGKTK